MTENTELGNIASAESMPENKTGDTPAPGKHDGLGVNSTNGDQVTQERRPRNRSETSEFLEFRNSSPADHLRCPAMAHDQEFMGILEQLILDWKAENGLSPDQSAFSSGLESKKTPGTLLAADAQRFFYGGGSHSFRGQDSVFERAENIFAERHAEDGLWQKYLNEEAKTVYKNLNDDPAVRVFRDAVWERGRQLGDNFSDEEADELLGNFEKSFPNKSSSYSEGINQWVYRYLIRPTAKIDASGKPDDSWLMKSGLSENQEADNGLKNNEYLANKNGLGFIRFLKTNTEAFESGASSVAEKIKRMYKDMQSLRMPVYLEAKQGAEVITLDIRRLKDTGNLIISSTENKTGGGPQTTEWEFNKDGEMVNSEGSPKFLLNLLTRLSGLEAPRWRNQARSAASPFGSAEQAKN